LALSFSVEINLHLLKQFCCKLMRDYYVKLEQGTIGHHPTESLPLQELLHITVYVYSSSMSHRLPYSPL